MNKKKAERAEKARLLKEKEEADPEATPTPPEPVVFDPEAAKKATEEMKATLKQKPTGTDDLPR